VTTVAPGSPCDASSVGAPISAIIPVLNGERFLEAAVASVLGQRHTDVEIVVVDDGSTDATPEVARRLGEAIRYVRQGNRGLPGARNTGLRESRGEWIAFLDVDDLWSDDKLALQSARLAASPAARIVLGRTQLLTESGGTFTPWGEPVLAASLGAALVRRRVFEDVGLFDETQRYCDDLDWFMRARERGVPIVVGDEVTLHYRRHGDNMTNQLGAGNHGLLSMLKKSLDRRRQERDVPRSLPDLVAAPRPAGDDTP